MKKLYILSLVFVLLGCNNTEEASPDMSDPRQEMINAMSFTAKAVSEITLNKGVRGELLGYARKEFDGEMVANFNSLLNVSLTVGGTQSNPSGTFSRLFNSKAQQYDESKGINSKLSTSNSIVSDLESYLKENNLALYGPYFAENHSDTDRPITVSFDPLDASKVSNVGYMFVPKSNSNGNNVNSDIDGDRTNFDDYELIEVENVNDDYAYNNPTFFVIPDDGNVNYQTANPNNNGGNTQANNRDIDCRTLTSDDILTLKMPEYRLLGNFSAAPWDRNFLSLWVSTGKLTFSDGEAVLGDETNQHWGGKQVSRKNGRKKSWLNSDIPYFESKWEAAEVELFYAFSRKEKSTLKITGKVGYNKDGVTASVDVSIEEQNKQRIITKQNLDRCLYLARHTRDLGFGTRNGQTIYRWDKLEFYMKPEISNIDN